MKNKFSSYYRPTPEWFNELWQTCTFVVDANVLLNLYRYSHSTSEEFLTLLESVQERFWIPYQAALEYQQRRLDVISSQTRAYTETMRLSQDLKDSLSSSRKHPFANEEIVEKTLGLLNDLESDLKKRQEEREKLLSDDPLQIRLGNLFTDKVGERFTEKKEQEIYQRGDERFELKIPPGYMDSAKSESKKYGDLKIWFEIIDYAKREKKNIIFITDDSKEDWWLEHKGRIIGPRPELIDEIQNEAEISFYMYRPGVFMQYANEHLQQEIKPESISEIRDLSESEKHENSVPQLEPVKLAQNISARYKAIKRFLENYDTVEKILDLNDQYDLSEFESCNDPNFIPSDLLAELHPLINDNLEAAKAIQAVHSLQEGILRKHIKKTNLPDEVQIDLFRANKLPKGFVRLMANIRDSFIRRKGELKEFLEDYFEE